MEVYFNFHKPETRILYLPAACWITFDQKKKKKNRVYIFSLSGLLNIVKPTYQRPLFT